MSSEVCPFCGKTFKRLKSHLPHCKAAESRTDPTERLVHTSPPLAAKGKKSRETPSVSPQTEKSARSSPAQTPDSTDSSSSSPPPSTQKKKQKPSGQIKLASMSSSSSSSITTTSLVSSPPRTPPPAASKPKKKSLRALIEAAKRDPAPEGPRLASEDLLSGSTPALTVPLSSRTSGTPDTDILTDGVALSPMCTGAKPKDGPKKKASKTKRAEQTAPPTEDRNVEETEDPNGTALTSGGGGHARITIQDAKALLGRAKASRKTILSRTEPTDDLSANSGLGTGLSLVTVPAETGKDAVRCLATTQTVSAQLLSAASQHTEALTKSKEQDGSSQPRLFTPESPLGQTSPPPGSVGAIHGQKVGRLTAGPPSLPPPPPPPPSVQFSSPHRLPLATETPAPRVDTARAADWLILEDRKQNAAHTRSEGAVSRLSLGQVKLRDLPRWLVSKAPTRPREAAEMLQRGRQWYYRKYIDVRKGGVGGLGMLLAGYCVLSYIWRYPHIKRDRWRKYH